MKQMKQTSPLHICLFSGPGAGKSTISSYLFYLMKKENYNVEYLTEYAKELVFSNDYFKLNDQLMVLANQHHPWTVLEEQLDYTINDGAFLLSLVYLQDKEHLPSKTFKKLVIEMYKSYNTLNIFLERNDELLYQEIGRNESLKEAIELDNKIMRILDENNIPYYKIKSNNKSAKKILKLMKEINE